MQLCYNLSYKLIFSTKLMIFLQLECTKKSVMYYNLERRMLIGFMRCCRGWRFIGNHRQDAAHFLGLGLGSLVRRADAFVLEMVRCVPSLQPTLLLCEVFCQHKTDSTRASIVVVVIAILHSNIHTHPFNGPLSGTTRVSRYQKGNTNLDFTEARDSEWQWHQLGHMQVCTSLQTDNHASTPPLQFFTGWMPVLPTTNSVNALKATVQTNTTDCKI